MRVLAVAGFIVAGCGYQADSLRFSGQHETAGCLDLSLDRAPDLPNGDAVIAYGFGNRCDHPVGVDLAEVTVFGRDEAGEQFQLLAFDPRHEIRPLRIDGRAVGREAIAYASEVPLDQICVDAASIVHAPTQKWMCFASRSEIP